MWRTYVLLKQAKESLAPANSLFPKERIKDYFHASLWEGSLARPHLNVPSDVLLRILLPNRLIENKVVVTHGKREEGRWEGQEGLGIKRYMPLCIK